MNFDTVALHCFLAVSDTKSFTKAAEQVGRTQSAVSQQINKLEYLLGKQLFKRGKLLILTKEGELFYGYAKQIFTLHCEAFDRFKEPELEGEIRFGMPEDFASVYLSDVLIEFSRIHPRIFLNVECDLTLNLFERFKKGHFDLVLVKMSRPEEFINGYDIYTEELVWTGDPKLIKQDISKSLPLVLSPLPCVYRSRAIKALEDADIKWRLVFSSPSYNGTIAAVKAGLGITVLPLTMVPPQLAIIKNGYLPVLDNTHVSLLKHDTKGQALATFEKFVINKLKY